MKNIRGKLEQHRVGAPEAHKVMKVVEKVLSEGGRRVIKEMEAAAKV